MRVFLRYTVARKTCYHRYQKGFKAWSAKICEASRDSSSLFKFGNCYCVHFKGVVDGKIARSIKAGGEVTLSCLVRKGKKNYVKTWKNTNHYS